MSLDIPGYYFDSERGRYFKITSGRERPTETYYHQQEIKKRKYREQNESSSKELYDRRSKLFERYLFQIVDPSEMTFGNETASKYLSGIMIQDETHKKSCSYNSDVNISFGIQPEHHDISGNTICECSSPGCTSLVFSTSSKVMNYRSSSVETFSDTVQELNDEIWFDLDDYFSASDESQAALKYSTFRLEGDRTSPEGLYFHAQRKDTNTHIFAQIFENRADIKIKCLSFKRHEHVHDSLCLGSHFAVAVGSYLRLYGWDASTPTLNKRLDSRNNSDIMTLAVDRQDRNLNKLYAGYRDGSIVVLPIASSCHLQFDYLSCYRPPGTRMIMTIKCTAIPGLIFASAILKDSQAVFMLDMMLQPSQRNIVMLKTSFINLTKEQELFQVTLDAHYVLYGSLSSREGNGDFQLFSTHLDDNLVFENIIVGNTDCIVYFPSKSTDQGSIADVNLSKKRLRSVSFVNYPFTHQFSSSLDNVGDVSHTAKSALIGYNATRSSYRLVIILEDSSQCLDVYAPAMTLITTDVL